MRSTASASSGSAARVTAIDASYSAIEPICRRTRYPAPAPAAATIPAPIRSLRRFMPAPATPPMPAASQKTAKASSRRDAARLRDGTAEIARVV